MIHHTAVIASRPGASGASRPSRRSRASSSSARQGDAVITASCRDLEPTELEASLPHCESPDIDGRRRRRRARTSSGRRRRGSPRSPRRRSPPACRSARCAPIRRGATAFARPSARRAPSRPLTGSRSIAAGQWAIIEAMPADLTTSTARDAAAGRPTELDAITGSVVRAANRLQVPVASLEALLAEARTRVGSPHERGRRPKRPARPGGRPGGHRCSLELRAVRPKSGRGCRGGVRAGGRDARAPPIPRVRVGLRPRDLHSVRLAPRAPPRAVQHRRPPHPARRPRRAGDRSPGSARDGRSGGSGDPRRADARAGRDRAAALPPGAGARRHGVGRRRASAPLVRVAGRPAPRAPRLPP